MSNFIGPNTYLIESTKAAGLYLNLDGGNKADGTKVVSKSTKNTEPSSHWAIVYLGIGKSNKEEYHILNRATGTYLTTTSAAKDQDDVTCNLKSPLDNVVRWSIVPVSNKPEQYGQYFLVPIQDTKQCLAIRGALKDKTFEGSQAITFDNTVRHQDLFWYLRLAPDAVLNCVEGLKA
ncbi:hypothetical protein Q7P36_010882 [Cladosporium allicinum]